MAEVQPAPMVVSVGGRSVPAVLWRRSRHDASLVLLGHGGGGHKTAPRQQLLADRLAGAGMTVLAIDGPAHGDRAPRPDMAPGEYQTDLVARGIESVVRDMVEDWVAALGAARAAGLADGPVGYLGMSMGTRFGLPLVAALGDDLNCAVLGKFGLDQGPGLHPGLHDAAQLRRDAKRVDSPILWHVQWDDELFPRAGQLELYDGLGSADKRMIAFPGEHGTTTDDALDAWLSFLLRRLPHD